MSGTLPWIWVPLAAPCVAALLALVAPRGRWLAYPTLLAALAVAASGVALLGEVRGGAGDAATAAGDLLRADALSSWLLTVVGVIATVAVAGGLTWTARASAPDAASDAAREDGRFWGLLAAFMAAMSLAVLADNLGVLWVAIEGTTIATAFLVGHRGGRDALEAAWKYVILGSVGVAIAFLGVVLIYAASLAGGSPTLSWRELAAGHPLDPTLATMGVGLAVLGFGTKAGLAPMHSWLPDAYSMAPAPASGLMSGVLSSVAFTAILRIQAVADAAVTTGGDPAVAPGLVRGMLVVGGLASLLLAGLMTLTQRRFKRLIAYSSIEHMGIMALGAAAGGPLGIAAVLLHILGHGLAKSSMFLLAWRIQDWAGSYLIADVRGLLARRPDLGGPFLAGAAALLGFPPFVTFVTEVAIVVALWEAGLGAVAIAMVALLLVAFAGIGRQVLTMTIGDGGPDDASAGRDMRPVRGQLAPVVAALTLAAGLSVAAVPLQPVLFDAASCVSVQRYAAPSPSTEAKP